VAPIIQDSADLSRSVQEGTLDFLAQSQPAVPCAHNFDADAMSVAGKNLMATRTHASSLDEADGKLSDDWPPRIKRSETDTQYAK
jgi:hypothetical protein